MLASVLEFQRDMISENTRQGVAAAEASGKTLGRPTALAPDKAAEIVTAYSQGATVKALAREHHVAPKTIRRVLDAAHARQLPDQLDALPVPEGPSGPAADTPVTLDLPGLLADHLRAVGDDTIRQALIWGRIIRRGQGLLHPSHHAARTPPRRAATERSPRRRGRRAGRTQGLPGVRHPHHSCSTAEDARQLTTPPRRAHQPLAVLIRYRRLVWGS
ncbi:helix-turn-helix domain-containing protein [Actinomadura sp. GTD37]|uniref:helix-turn-helix domain-containing protein n=1 Tax=Actinomadura sp. GTD37 TaxID=1778030 RepID=UPI0035BFBB29